MAWQGFSNDNAPEAFGAMVRRQGASGGGGFRRPGGGYDGGGINPGGMYGDGGPIQGGPGSPPRPDTTGGMGPDPADGSRFRRPGGGYDGSGINPGGMYGGSPIQGGPFGPPRPDMTGGPVGDPAYPAKPGGRPWSYENRSEQQRPGGGYGPYGGYGTPPGNGGIIPPGPHGGGPKGFPGMDGGSEVGSNPDQRPMPIPDPRFPRNQPGMTRNQWQQNRLGNAPRLPIENPINPTEDWLGRSNGAPQGWNWSR